MVKVIENQNNNENMNLDEENLSLDEAKYNQSTSINLSKYKKDNTTINESKIKTNTSENKFYISPEINKGPWTPSEDELLIEYVKKYGPKRWNVCAEFLKNRTSKQCREHWKNCLDPEIKKGDWTFEEDLILMAFYSKCKGSWSQLIHYFNDRTENSIKNRFFSELRKIAANDPNKKETNQEDNEEKNNNYNLNNFLEINQMNNPLDTSFTNYDLMDEKSEYDEKNEFMKEMNENIEQNNIKRSSSDLIEFILSKGYLSNEGILSLGKR